MTIYDEAVALAGKLSIAEKVQLIAHLSTALKDDLAIEAYKHIPWEQFLDLTYGSLADDPLDEMGYPLGYFEETYGILADDPIERNQPLYPDVRDEIE